MKKHAIIPIFIPHKGCNLSLIHISSPLREETAEPERKGTEAADAYSVYEEIIKDNIEYEHFKMCIRDSQETACV